MSHHAVIARPENGSWRGRFCDAGEIPGVGKSLWKVVERDGLTRGRRTLLDEHVAWYMLGPDMPDIEGPGTSDQHIASCPFCDAAGGVSHGPICLAVAMRRWAKENAEHFASSGGDPSEEPVPFYVADYGLAYPNPDEWLTPDDATPGWIGEVWVIEDGGLRLFKSEWTEPDGFTGVWVEGAFFSWSEPEPDWETVRDTLYED